MPTNNTIKKYVHIDSRSRMNHETKTNFKVKLPHGFAEASKVAVKSFSIANSFWNMTGRKMKWCEFYNNGTQTVPNWDMAIFEGDLTFKMDGEFKIDIEPYLENDQLATHIQSVFDRGTEKASVVRYKFEDQNWNTTIIATKVNDNQTNRSTLTVQYNTDTYKFKLTPGSNTTKEHLFALYHDEGEKNSIWELMGYDTNKLFTKDAMNRLFNELQAQTIGYDVNIRNNSKTKFLKEIRNTSPNRGLVGSHVSHHENHMIEVNICSDSLGRDGYLNKNGLISSTNILETVTNNASKFSWLHHQPTQLHYHTLDHRIGQTFDIQLFDNNNNMIDPDSCGDFKLVLIFQIIEEIEFNIQDMKRYNAIGYELGHPIK